MILLFYLLLALFILYIWSCLVVAGREDKRLNNVDKLENKNKLES